MRKLNQVLETSIKSSYRTRYEYNLNDYKKNFQMEPHQQQHNYLEEEAKENSENEKKKVVVKEEFDYNEDEEDNVILSKRFFAEKNPNLALKPTKPAKTFLAADNFDKSDKYQNTLNLQNKQNSFAEFEEVERIIPQKTALNNNNYKSNIVKTKADFQQQLTSAENKTDYSYSNKNTNNNYSNKESAKENVVKINNDKLDNSYTKNYRNSYINNISNNSSNLNPNNKNPPSLNNFTQLNHQFESFNLGDVLKTADNISKNKNTSGVEHHNNKRVEITNKVYDIHKLKKMNVSNPDENNILNNNFNNNKKDYFYSANDNKNSLENDNYNSYSDTNFTNNKNNNVKKEADEFDYLKNLLMKTQMEIQNFNNEFDNNNNVDFNNDFNRNSIGKSVYYSKNNNTQESIYNQDSAENTIPRKQPKPTKPDL